MIPLQTFSAGDTDYIAKHNANYAAVRAAIEAIEALVAGASSGAASLPALLQALFGANTALIGAGSYACSGAGSTLTVAAGFAWLAGSQIVVSKATTTALSFSGLAAATYYITVDATGTPVRSTSATDALYSVAWTGSAFGAITRVAAIAWAFDDWDRAKTSTALGASYDRLDDRLEAGETKAVAGDLARTWLTGRLAKNVAGGSDHMLGYDKNLAVNPFNPFLNMWMAMTRVTTEGVTVYPEESITREEALKMYTVWAAWQEFSEKRKGSIEKGKLADLVVIDRDFLACPVEDIRKIEPLMTIVNGKAVYTAPGI